MKYFGTDGIRGKVGDAPITPRFFTKLAWAVGQVFRNKDTHAKVLIGKDTRISGYMLESAMMAGFASAGADATLTGPIPTPAISYLTRTFGADVGVVISASHNGYHDNGVKFFSRQGTKLGDDVEAKIEEYLESTTLPMPEARDLGRAARLVDAKGRYIEFCKGSMPRNSDLRGLKLVVDCAHGATYDIAENIFAELGAEVEVINNQPDGININENCGSTNPECIRKATLASKADVGIAFDGDGDRVLMCDSQGNLADGDVLLYILAKYMQDIGTLAGKQVIGTVATNSGLEASLKKLGISLKRVNVGDRHLVEELVGKGMGNLGGESSGHMVCTRYTTTGDGLIIALQVLTALKHFGGEMATLVKEAGLIPAKHENIRCKNPKQVMADPKMLSAIKELDTKIKGRLLVRPSGTEPILRVSIESTDNKLCDNAVAEIKKIAKQVEAPAKA